MATLQKAIETLAQVERALRALVGRAAADGEYDAVARLIEAARAVGDITRALKNGTAPKKIPATSTSGTDVPVDQPVRTGAAKRGARASKSPRARRSKRPPARGEYPKFSRRGDDLLKTGWSKKQREEYVHKAPRRVIEAVAAAIARRAGNGKLFTAEQLFTPDRPLKDPTTGEKHPGYQGYVTLAWFRTSGLVQPHGRRGYTARNAERLPDALAAAWHSLPESAD